MIRDRSFMLEPMRRLLQAATHPAWAYALAAQGGPGVARLLELLEAEMRVAMALTGSTDVSRLDRRILAA